MDDTLVNPFGPAPGQQPDQQSKVQTILGKLQAIAHADPSKIPAIRPVWNAMREFAQLPSEGTNAVLGSLQRVSNSRLANAPSNKHGNALINLAQGAAGPLGLAAASADPRVREQLGHDVYNVFHPNDTGDLTKAEKNTGVSKLKSSDPRFRGKAQNFIVDTLFQNLTDPFNAGAAGFAAAGDSILKGIGEGMDKGLMHPNKMVRDVTRTFATNVEEREAGRTPQEIAAINTARNKGIVNERLAESDDRELLGKYSKEIKQGTIPPEIRARLPQKNFELNPAPLDIGHGGLKQYLADQMQKRRAADRVATTEQALAGHLGGAKNDLSYGYKPGGVNPPIHPMASVKPVPMKETPHVLGYETGQQKIPPQMEAAPPQYAQPKVGSIGAAPEAGPKYTQAEINKMAALPTQGWQYEGFAPIRAASRIQQEAMTSVGIPHIKNVGVVGFMSLGEGGMAKASARAIGKIPQELVDRLGEGAKASFGAKPQSSFVRAIMANPVVNPIRKALSHALDKFDLAVRATRLEQIDKEFPEMTEAQKLDRVNDDIGAYNKSPQFVRWQRGFLGANFPQWHNYIVPTTMFRAAVRNPGRYERLARAEQNANDEFAPNSKERITLGGGQDEFASLLADPARVLTGASSAARIPSYLLGPSSAGPFVSGLLRTIQYGPKKELPQIGSSFLPLGSTALDLIANPFKSPLPKPALAGTGLIGAYAQKRPPGSLGRTLPPPVPVNSGVSGGLVNPFAH